MIHPFPVATEPARPRDHARLLVVNKQTGEPINTKFFRIAAFFKPGDCLVLNTSLVFPARLCFFVDGKEGEVLLAAYPKNGETVPVKMKSSTVKRLARAAGAVRFAKNNKMGKIEILTFDSSDMTYQARLDLPAAVKDLGEVPLPPYILRARRARAQASEQAFDSRAYQCVYARTPGSIAAPTAGLHWTKRLLEKLAKQGVTIARLLLHVGFASVLSTDGRDCIPAEEYRINAREVNKILKARRVIACGTSSVRALETWALEGKKRENICGRSGLFIQPGYQFRCVQGLITNFHLPDSTHFLLTQAFLTWNPQLERWTETQKMGILTKQKSESVPVARSNFFVKAKCPDFESNPASTGDSRLTQKFNLANYYQQAASLGFQFYSYGDAMFIL